MPDISDPKHRTVHEISGMRSIVSALLMVCLSGCQAGYYLHLAKGHTDLMRERTPVSEVLAGMPQTV